MKADRVFKWIWNINGLVLLLGLILTLAVISYQLSKDSSDQQPSLNVAKDEDGEEKWNLGYPNRIGETDYYYVQLESEKLYVKNQSRVESFSMYDYKPTRAKNVVFINSNTNKSNWLFESVQQLITEIRLLSSEDELKSIIKAISYEVINSDTNKDGIFDNSDKRIFALSKIDGTGYSEIIEGYNRIVSSRVNNEGNLFVVFIDNDTVYTMLIDLSLFKVLDKKALPKVSDS
tara:strand:+ start:2256 stop:2951 length:696 start_codon:yes stop_codon:yes gene_type:complete